MIINQFNVQITIVQVPDLGPRDKFNLFRKVPWTR